MHGWLLDHGHGDNGFIDPFALHLGVEEEGGGAGGGQSTPPAAAAAAEDDFWCALGGGGGGSDQGDPNGFWEQGQQHDHHPHHPHHQQQQRYPHDGGGGGGDDDAARTPIDQLLDLVAFPEVAAAAAVEQQQQNERPTYVFHWPMDAKIATVASAPPGLAFAPHPPPPPPLATAISAPPTTSLRPSPSSPPRLPRATSSVFTGATKHRRSGRWEAHIWVREAGGGGKQVYLGGHQSETLAARAYDVVHLKQTALSGKSLNLNFPLADYAELAPLLGAVSSLELVAVVRQAASAHGSGDPLAAALGHCRRVVAEAAAAAAAAALGGGGGGGAGAL